MKTLPSPFVNPLRRTSLLDDSDSSRDDDTDSPNSSDAASPTTTPTSKSLLSQLLEYYANAQEMPDSKFLVQQERVTNFLSVPTQFEQLMLFGYFVCLDSFLGVFTTLPVGILKRSNLLKLLLILSCLYFFSYIDSSQLYHSIRGQAVIKLYVIFNVLEIADRLCCSFGQDILDSLYARSTFSLPHFLLSLLYVFTHTLVLFYQVITLNVAINSHNNALFTLLISNQFVEIKGSVFKKFEKENLFQVSCSDIVERFQLAAFLAVITVRNLLELHADFGTVFFYNFSLADLSNFLRNALPNLIYNPFSVTLDFSSYYNLVEALLYPVVVVFMSEVLVDWLKHAFITKFNQIRPVVYGKYLDILCFDYLHGRSSNLATTEGAGGSSGGLGHYGAFVARRIGFATLPLACLIIRVSYQTANMMGWTSCPTFSVACWTRISIGWLLAFIGLLLLKFTLATLLFRYSKRRCQNIKSLKSSLQVSKSTPNFENHPPLNKEDLSMVKKRLQFTRADSADVVEKEKLIVGVKEQIVGDVQIARKEPLSLDNISRYELYKSRIP